MNLHIQSVSKSIGSLQILDDVSLTAPSGAITGIIGPNGAGKSTLFSVVSGFAKADQGVIALGSVDLSRLSPVQRAKRGLGRTFQVPREFRHLTVEENFRAAVPNQPGENIVNVFMRPGVVSAYEKNLEAEVASTIEFLKLGRVARTPAGLLSGGQKKLVELGRAMLMKPSVILLDEPFAGVNRVLIGEIMARIREINAKGVAFLIIEHDLEALTKIATELFVLDRGKIISQGAPAEVLKDRRVRDAYLGGAE